MNFMILKLFSIGNLNTILAKWCAAFGQAYQFASLAYWPSPLGVTINRFHARLTA